MSIFNKVNNNVEKFSMGLKSIGEYNNISNTFAAKEYVNNQKVLEHCNEIERQVAITEKMYNIKKQGEKVILRQLNESQMLNKLDEINRKSKEMVFKEILFEMFSKSLILDETFVAEQYSNLKGLIDEYVDKRNGIKLLENAAHQSKSKYLSSVLEVCESISKKVSLRKMQEVKNGIVDIDSIDFGLNTEEKEELNDEKEKLSMDELSNLVKDKVLQVVKDEKQRQSREQELNDDIESEITTEEDKKVAESLRNVLFETPVEESTLFNSIFRHSFKITLENLSITHSAQQEEEDSRDQIDKDKNAINTDEEDITKDEFQETNIDDMIDGEYDLDEELEDALIEKKDVDMDEILAEAITKYTLMELAYTIKLENYQVADIRKMSQIMLK